MSPKKPHCSECARPVVARGLCATHYQQLLRTGSPKRVKSTEAGVKVLVTMPPPMAELVDAAAGIEGVTRVEWIRRAMRVRLGEAVT